MQHIEFAILAGLLALVLWRTPIPWRSNMLNVIILRKLNRLNPSCEMCLSIRLTRNSERKSLALSLKKQEDPGSQSGTGNIFR